MTLPCRVCRALVRARGDCNTLQHSATHCNALQHTDDDVGLPGMQSSGKGAWRRQHTATRYNKTHTRTCTAMCTRTHTCANEHAHIHTHTRTHTTESCKCAVTNCHKKTSRYMSISIQIQAFAYVCIGNYTQVFIYTYTFQLCTQRCASVPVAKVSSTDETLYIYIYIHTQEYLNIYMCTWKNIHIYICGKSCHKTDEAIQMYRHVYCVYRVQSCHEQNIYAACIYVHDIYLFLDVYM